MEKPTLEEVKDYFKNAKIIKCLSSGRNIDLKYMTTRGIHTFNDGYWIDFDNHPQFERNSCLIWDKKYKRYSQIIEYSNELSLENNSQYEIY